MGANEVIKVLRELGADSKESAVCANDIKLQIGCVGVYESLPTPYRKGLLILKREGNIKYFIADREIVTQELRRGHKVTVRRKLKVEYYYL